MRVTYKCNRQGQQDTSKEGNTQEEEIHTERDKCRGKIFQSPQGYDRTREEDDQDTKRVQHTNKEDDVPIIIPSGWPGNNTIQGQGHQQLQKQNQKRNKSN